MADRNGFAGAALKQADLLRADLAQERRKVMLLSRALEAAKTGARQLQALAVALLVDGKPLPVEKFIAHEVLDSSTNPSLEVMPDDLGVRFRVFLPEPPPADGDEGAKDPAPEPTRPSLVLAP